MTVGSIGLPPLYTEMRVKLDTFKSEMNKATAFATAKASEITRSMQKANKVADNMVSFGKKATLGVTLPIAAASAGVFKFAKDYESAFAGVRKTTDATEAEYLKLSKGIRQMSKEMPASAVSIAQVAEAAGQLGIKKEDILKFSKTMVDLGVATNLTATEAATSLARFSNIMGTSADNVDRLGSTIVHLGNNTATTEREIVEMGMRLAGAGKQVGLTEAQVLGLAAAMSSVGIEAEMGGSAMSKLLVQMKLATTQGGEALDNFAKASGVSASQFKQAFEKDASQALLMFLKGLKNASTQGKSAIEILDDMGISEVRLRDTILRASEASDKFSDTLQLANQGWRENTALQKEAQQRYKTTESQLQIAKNKLIDIAITLGTNFLPKVNQVLNVVGDFADTLNNMSPTMQSVVGWTALAAASIGPLTFGVGKAIKAFVLFKSGIGAVSTFVGKVFKKDISSIGTQSTKSATEFGRSANLIVKASDSIKLSMSQIGSTYQTQSNSISRNSDVIIAKLKAIQVEARNTATALRGVQMNSAGGSVKTSNKKTRKEFDSRGIDVYTSKTKQLGETASNTGKKVKGLGNTATVVSNTVKANSSKVATATTTVAKSGSRLASIMSKGTTALRTIGRSALTATPLLLDLGLGLGGTATAVASMGGSLLAGAGALGSLAVAAAPVVAGVGAVAAIGYGVYKAFTHQAVPAVDLYKSKTELVFNEATGRMERHVEKVSEATKKEFEHYYGMTEKIRTAASDMYFGLYNDADKGHQEIIKNVEQYKADYLAKVEGLKQEKVSKMTEMVSKMGSLTAEERDLVVRTAKETEEKTIESTKTRLSEIVRLSEELKTASGTHAQELKDRIIQLTNEQDQESVRILAQNKIEQEIIMTNLKERAGQITEEQAAEVVRKLNEMRDGAIKSAEETRDETLRRAEEWKEGRIRTTGKLSEEEQRIYEKMKKDALETYKKSKEGAEELRNEGLRKLREEYPELDRNIDINAGKVKSWGQHVLDAIRAANREPLMDKYATYTITGSSVGLGALSTLPSGHYNGLDYVPYDGYHARLHRGERVLTAEENKTYMEGGKGGDINVSIDKVYNNTPNDARKIAQQLGLEIRKQRLGGGLA
nr:MAG TPA: minor tail protein [Caudoviricetes sp.]